LSVLELCGYPISEETAERLLERIKGNKGAELASLRHQNTSPDDAFLIATSQRFVISNGALSQEEYEIAFCDPREDGWRPEVLLKRAKSKTVHSVDLEIEMPPLTWDGGLGLINRVLSVWGQEEISQAGVHTLMECFAEDSLASMSSADDDCAVVFVPRALCPELAERDPDGLAPRSVLIPQPSCAQIAKITRGVLNSHSHPVSESLLEILLPFVLDHEDPEVESLWTAAGQSSGELDLTFQRRLLVGDLLDDEQLTDYDDRPNRGSDDAFESNSYDVSSVEDLDISAEEMGPPTLFSSVVMGVPASDNRINSSHALPIALLSTGAPFPPCPTLGDRCDTTGHALLVDFSQSPLPSKTVWGQVLTVAKGLGVSFSVNKARFALKDIALADRPPEVARYCEGGVVVEVEIG
jgi:hypothetical protein